MLLAALDAYVVVTILVDIMSDLGVPIEHPERATPIVTAYLLGYVAAMPLLGQLSDRIGRVPVIQGCLAIFAVGSVVTALAPGLPVLAGGRLVQGAAGGALLPVTFAVISDHWAAKQRAVPLGLVGAAQELGSVLGPLYGAGVAALIGWRGVFWVNIPLAALAIVAVRRSLPATSTNKGVHVDLGGGLILAGTLALATAGLYNPDPEKAVLPAWGIPCLAGAAIGLAAFAFWERRSPHRLLDPKGLAMRQFSTAMVCSFLSGIALMATLVDIPLFAQTLLNRDALGGALILSRFLAALAIGALGGGFLTSRTSERPVAVAGFAVATAAFWQVAGWPAGIETLKYPLGISRMGLDLVVAGFGLGIVIAPLASVALRAASAVQHGVVSASMVVSRMMGMLIGIAVLGAAGVHRFQQLTADLVPPLPFVDDFEVQLRLYEQAVGAALRVEYSEIFRITALVCASGAIVALLLKPLDSDATSGSTLSKPKGGT